VCAVTSDQPPSLSVVKSPGCRVPYRRIFAVVMVTARVGALVQIIPPRSGVDAAALARMKSVTGLPAGRALRAPSTAVLAMAWRQCVSAASAVLS
jgi:hypothetical protein